jgi:hypothetical protein
MWFLAVYTRRLFVVFKTQFVILLHINIRFGDP